MSKKKKSQKKQENLAQSVTALTSNGVKAFHQKDFERAIQTWEKIPANLRPVKLLAEASFRHGLALFYGADAQAGLIYLQRAVTYQPGDPGYTYHLGLAKHRQNDISGALAAYPLVTQSAGPFGRRAAYPLALALLQSGQDPATSPNWNALTPDEQTMLRSASAFRRRPYQLPTHAPLIWRALTAFDAGEHAEALSRLTQVVEGGANPTEQSLAYFYLGALAAKIEDWDVARRAWEAAYRSGLRMPRLLDNLAELYHRRAEELLLQGDAKTAFAAAQEAKRHRPEDKALDELLARIHQHLGYQAAAADRWDEAQSHWQAAVELDSASFRLAYNLALAYEKSGRHISAGETWREALRRRPRRADHPDALSDEQVARLWQRAAECYRKGGEFEEVGRTYQQAIKWAPDNLNLRLALAESQVNDGRFQAARNELERIIERSPQHIPALLRLGETYFRDEDAPWYVKAQAKKYWERALALDPNNPQARQMMAEWYFDQAEIDYSWDRYAGAAENYQKTLEFRPNHIKTLVYLAECYINLKDTARGEEFAGQALAHAATFDDFDTIIDRWVCLGNDERAWEALAQAEARLSAIPTDYYVSKGCHALKHERKAQAQRWLTRAIQKATPEDNVLAMIGEMAMYVDPPLAMDYLHKALDARQNPGLAHLLLGILEARQDNSRASNKHFAEAKRIARQTKDEKLAMRVETARNPFGSPGSILRRLIDMGGSGILNALSEEFDEEFDDD